MSDRSGPQGPGRAERTPTIHPDDDDGSATGAAPAESEERFRLVVENSRDAITLTRDHQLEWASPAIEDVFGIPAAELTGRAMLDAVHPEDAPSLAAAREQLDAGEAVAYRCRVRHRSGTWHWVDLRIRPLADPRGRDGRLAVANWRLVDEDVAHLEALARSEAANRELSAQLQRALGSRVLIEQAKGMVAEQRRVTPDAAFEVLRSYSRRHGRKLADVVHDVVHLHLRP